MILLTMLLFDGICKRFCDELWSCDRWKLTTAQNAPSSKTLFNFAGVLIPSAITGCFIFGKDRS